jgi:hypothetical protein
MSPERWKQVEDFYTAVQNGRRKTERFITRAARSEYTDIDWAAAAFDYFPQESIP